MVDRFFKITSTIIVLAILFSPLVSAPRIVRAATYSVDTLNDNHDANLGDGICNDGSGHCSLRAAIEEGNSWPTSEINFSIDGTILISNGTMTINKMTHVNGNGPTRTIVDGQSTTDLFYSDTITSGGEDSFVSFSGITITHGKPAVNVKKGYVRFTNVVFQDNNNLLGNGGAISCSSLFSKISIFGGSFLSNNAVNGGAILSICSIIIEKYDGKGTLFRSNTTDENGGAIYFSGKKMVLKDAYFDQNVATFHGGGIYFNAGDMTSGNIIDNVVLINNEAKGSGGGIYHVKYDLVITNSSISRNKGVNGGGVYTASYLEIENSTIGENHASNSGGGIYNKSGSLELSSVSIVGNIADFGDDGDGNGGGIFQESDVISMRNSILAENEDNSGGEFGITAPDCLGTITSEGYNLVGAVTPGQCNVTGDLVGLQKGTKNSPLDPQLGVYDDDTYFTPYFPVLTGSRVIDAGNPAGCVDADGVLLPEDQHGELRKAGYACDLGAVESPYSTWRVYLPLIIR
jgi:CSLREA domain-containing protein